MQYHEDIPIHGHRDVAASVLVFAFDAIVDLDRLIGGVRLKA